MIRPSGKTIISFIRYLVLILLATSGADFLMAAGKILADSTGQDSIVQKRAPENQSVSDDIYKMIYRSIFIDSTRQRNQIQEGEFVEAHEVYLPFTGKTIRNIYYKKVPIFGGSVYDTLAMPSTALTRTAESIHINTRDHIITNNLLFSAGDTINAYQIADNARILRDLNFVYDANILIIPADHSDQLVDLMIITQDKFSIGIGGSVYDTDRFKANLYDRNLFGMGWELNNIVYYNARQSPVWGYDGKFYVSNINSTFISGLLNYKNTFETEGLQFALSRPFLTPQIKYGGGIDLNQMHVFSDLNNTRLENHSVFRQDYWLGRSFPLPDPTTRKNLTLSVRYINEKFGTRPDISPDSNHVFHNNDIFLAAFFLSRVYYFKSQMILGFGHTEDVPYGYSFSVTGGMGKTEFEKRWYGGINLQAATFTDDFGYFLGSVNAGSYYDGRRFENGVIRFDGFYFSNLLELGAGFDLRQFFKGNYTVGIQRLDDDQLNMDEDNKLREFVSDKYAGSQRLSFGFETVAFSPWNWFGFRYALVGFADFGWIGSNHRVPDMTRLSSVFGFKFRLRNESLVLSTFEVGFAFYPNSPDGSGHFGWRFSTSEPILIRRLESKKPQIVPYE